MRCVAYSIRGPLSNSALDTVIALLCVSDKVSLSEERDDGIICSEEVSLPLLLSSHEFLYQRPLKRVEVLEDELEGMLSGFSQSSVLSRYLDYGH